MCRFVLLIVQERKGSCAWAPRLNCSKRHPRPTPSVGTTHSSTCSLASTLMIIAAPVNPAARPLSSGVKMRKRGKGTSDMLKNAAALIPTWFQCWGLRSLVPVEIVVNNRLRRTRGRAIPRDGRIEIRPDLISGSRQNLLETLCHEAAHIAIFDTHANARPHGPEWQELVRAAGFEPHVQQIAECRLTRAQAISERADRSRLGGAVRVFDHRCPVCQMLRTAKRPVPHWRCAECVDSGLAGELLISARTRQLRSSD